MTVEAIKKANIGGILVTVLNTNKRRLLDDSKKEKKLSPNTDVNKDNLQETYPRNAGDIKANYEMVVD